MKMHRCKILCVLMTFTLAVTMFCVPAAAAKYKSSDARSALRIAAMLESTNLRFDFDEDGRVTANDARKILRNAAQLTEPDQSADSELVAAEKPIASENDGTQKGVLSACGLTEAQLSKGLKKSLKQYAGDFLAAEAEYGVNAVFLSAVAALESGWGESGLAKSNNNLFGWRGNGGYRSFESVGACIKHVAKFLKTNYLTPGGSCFYGYEVESIERSYCPNGNWAGAVRNLMRSILADAK